MEQVMNFVSLAWPFLVLVGIMYFFMYRPQQKLKVERGRFLMSLRKGDHVVTAGGIHGTIKVLRDKYVELEIAPKVIIKVEKTAIQHGDVKLIDEETAKKAGAAALGAGRRLQRVYVGKAGQRRQLVVQFGVIFHGAGPQRIEPVIHAMAAALQCRIVAGNLAFCKFW